MEDTNSNQPIVEEFDLSSFDFPDEEVVVDSEADAFAPYNLAPAGLYVVKGGYNPREVGISKKTFPAKGKKEEFSFLSAEVDFILARPAEAKLENTPVEDYENQHVFFSASSTKRRDNNTSKMAALLLCADPDITAGSMRDSDVVRAVDALLRRGFEGVVEIDWRGYNKNTKKAKVGQAAFPKDAKTGKRIARYRDTDGTIVDGQLEIIKLIPAAAMQTA